MSGEGRFFTTLGAGVPTDIPGGINTDGRIKSVQGNFMELNFDSWPAFSGKVLADGSTFAHAAPTGATGDENLMVFPEGTLEWHVLGTQTILAPHMVATGLQVDQDATNNDGIEISGGVLAKNKTTFVVGTDPAFYAKLSFSIADVSGTDDCAFGFKKVEAYQANIDDYADMVVLNVISGDIKIETIVGGAATVTTDTTSNWADAASHTLEVYVSAAGVVTYKIDGITPATVAAYTFTTALRVVPFFYFLNDTDLAGDVIFTHLECGPQ
jgi:hypothetical protein